jgi:DNA polymerase III epsilon subunit-like protein
MGASQKLRSSAPLVEQLPGLIAARASGFLFGSRGRLSVTVGGFYSYSMSDTRRRFVVPLPPVATEPRCPPRAAALNIAKCPPYLAQARVAAKRRQDAQCNGLTKQGLRCSITSASSMVDSIGRLVAEPLRRGGSHCLFHATWFYARPSVVMDPLLCFFDLETTGLNLASDSIVEIGLWVPGTAAFSTVVRPPVLAAEPGVHGIPNSELLEGPSFAQAFGRMMAFLQNAIDTACVDDSDSSQEVERRTRLKAEVPQIVLVAHNGLRFDFPMLASECLRHNVPWDELGNWHFVDTMDVFRALGAEEVGGCFKLQCLARDGQEVLRAHRALDDAIALQNVLDTASGRLGVSVASLIRPFVCAMDGDATAVQLSVLVGK